MYPCLGCMNSVFGTIIQAFGWCKMARCVVPNTSPLPAGIAAVAFKIFKGWLNSLFSCNMAIKEAENARGFPRKLPWKRCKKLPFNIFVHLFAHWQHQRTERLHCPFVIFFEGSWSSNKNRPTAVFLLASSPTCSHQEKQLVPPGVASMDGRLCVEVQQASGLCSSDSWSNLGEALLKSCFDRVSAKLPLHPRISSGPMWCNRP